MFLRVELSIKLPRTDCRVETGIFPSYGLPSYRVQPRWDQPERHTINAVI